MIVQVENSPTHCHQMKEGVLQGRLLAMVGDLMFDGEIVFL